MPRSEVAATGAAAADRTLAADRTVRAAAFVYGQDGARSRDAVVPVETPVEVAYGGVPFAVMMLTPQDLEDFGLGFSLTEGLIAAASDIRRMAVETVPGGLRLDIELVPDRMSRHLARRRAMSGRTGCGVCGIQDIAALETEASGRPVRAPAVALDALERAVAGLEERQDLNARTHAVHAAGWAGLDGHVLHVREDVGRHNALDKLIGALLRHGVEAGRGFLVITSRCSFEMVDKAAAFGAGMLVAVSGPTSLALEKAGRLGMTICGVARRDGVLAFTGESRLARAEMFA